MPIARAPIVLAANSPILPPSVTQEATWAIKAIAAGEADKGQQAMAMRWIIQVLCGTYDLPYRPESSRDTDLALGKMHVGQQLVRLINMPSDRVATLPRIGGATDGDDDEIRNM